MDRTRSEEVNDFIALNWKMNTDRQMAEALGLTPNAIRQRRLKLGLRRPERVDAKKEISLEKLLDVLRKNQKGISVVELANHFGVPPRVVQAHVDALRGDGNLLVDAVGDSLQLAKSMPTVYEPVRIDMSQYPEHEFCIGAIADTHLGSKWERLDVLETLYDHFSSRGVRKVYLAGNMIEGEARFNRYDISVHGVAEQVKNFLEKFPQRPGITTEFITGDDHEGWYIQRENINVGQVIVDRGRAAGRNDLVYLGHIERDIEFVQPGGSAVLRVIHGGGGSVYAISYTSQKYVESLQGGEKPKIVIMGHFHKFDWCYPREVHVIQPGCTQEQSTFMRKKRIQAMVGGCVLWIKQNELGIFTSVKVEWLPFYDRKFYGPYWQTIGDESSPAEMPPELNSTETS
jgi:predicted phosphodiesterase